jgi:hypothetical protein
MLPLLVLVFSGGAAWAANAAVTGTSESSLAKNTKYINETLGFQITLDTGWYYEELEMSEQGGEICFYPDKELLGFSRDDINFVIGRFFDASLLGNSETAEVPALAGELFKSALESYGMNDVKKISAATVQLNANIPEALRSVWEYTYTGGLGREQLPGETVLYVVSAGRWGDTYVLYYNRALSHKKAEFFAETAEAMLAAFTPLDGSGASVSLEPKAPDFLDFAGKYNQWALAEALGGMTDVYVEEASGFVFDGLYCAYYFEVFVEKPPPGVEAYWEPRYPGLLHGVILRDKRAPLTVGGVRAGMDIKEARDALEKAGYKQNVDLWEGRANLFYELYYDQPEPSDQEEESGQAEPSKWSVFLDIFKNIFKSGAKELPESKEEDLRRLPEIKEGDLRCFVEINTENGVVSRVTAWWGPQAVHERAVKTQN